MSSYLPEEIVLNILSRLQVKPLSRFRCVCKSWCKLLTRRDFVRMHLNHAVDEKNNNCSLMIVDDFGDIYSIDSVSSSSSELCYMAVQIDIPFKSRLFVNISGSCNGLLCVATDYHGGNYFIWNPSTKEYKDISSPSITSRPSHIAYGFGYDGKMDDYKLVTIVYNFYSVDANIEVNVYTLGSNSWRTIQSVPRNFFDPIQSAGVLLNGALHWIEAIVFDVIVSFNIGDERFQEFKLPNCLVGSKDAFNVGVLSGDLCILGHMSGSHDSWWMKNDLWVMKDYGVVESWTKLFSIPIETSIYSYLKPIHTFKNGEILFWVGLKKENDRIHGLVSYDPKHERARMLKIQGTPKLYQGIETYVGSLVSPNQVLS